MNISLLPVDSTYPNLALMKLSAWHKQHGDTVQWYNPLDKYDKVYMAKVFSFTPDYGYYINADEVEKGGTGYDLHKVLPKAIDPNPSITDCAKWAVMFADALIAELKKGDEK